MTEAPALPEGIQHDKGITIAAVPRHFFRSLLDDFLATWPDIDPRTGLTLRGNELLIKARDAMIAVVHIFNGAGLTFRTELFIVTSIIAWTYLLRAWFRREGID